MPPLPTMPATAALKEEYPIPTTSKDTCSEPKSRKVKLEPVKYDDWLNDVICVDDEEKQNDSI